MRNRGGVDGIHFIGFILAAGILGACGGGGGGGGVIDPSDSNGVADALRVKLGDVDASQVSGDPPQQDPQAAGNPVVNVFEGQGTAVTPGESKDISVDTSTSGDSVLAVLYAKVAGADSYFEAQAAQTQSLRTKQDGTTVVTFDIPENLGSGEFCVELSIGDSESRVSNVEEICFTSTPEDGSAAATLEALQGNWERCIDGRIEILTIEGDIADFSETSYANANCTGEVVGTFSDTLRLTIGPQLTTDSGLTANELDIEIIDSPDPDDIGMVEYDIIRVEDDQFFVGEGEASSAENRPTSLNLNNPYLPLLDNGGGDATPRQDQTWDLNVSGTLGGEGGNDIFQDTQSGDQVPLSSPTDEQIIAFFYEFLREATAFNCDPFVPETETVRESSYSFNGSEVGSTVELFYDAFVDGECTQNGDTFPLSAEAQLDYTWTRVD